MKNRICLPFARRRRELAELCIQLRDTRTKLVTLYALVKIMQDRPGQEWSAEARQLADSCRPDLAGRCAMSEQTAAARGVHNMDTPLVGPPVDGRLRVARRGMVLVLLIGAAILLALVAGVLDHPPAVPIDPGTPSIVTTIGGPR